MISPICVTARSAIEYPETDVEGESGSSGLTALIYENCIPYRCHGNLLVTRVGSSPSEHRCQLSIVQ